MSRSARTQLYRKAVAAGVALVWLFGLTASVFHADHDEHRYCAEHAAFEDVRPRAGDAAEGARVAHAADGLAHIERHPGERADEHERCAFAQLSVQGTAERHQARAVRSPVIAPAPTAPVIVLVAPPIPLLHLAPKSSPPSASV